MSFIILSFWLLVVLSSFCLFVDCANVTDVKIEGRSFHERQRLSHLCNNYNCLNEGRCVLNGPPYEPICVCPMTHRGRYCENAVVGLCEPSCVNGECRLMNGRYVCVPNLPPPTQAPPSTQACSPNPCSNNCQCIESCRHSKGYYCSSPAGFLGKNCNIPPPTLLCGVNSITINVMRSFMAEYDTTRSSVLVVSESPTSAITGNCQFTPSSLGFNRDQIMLPIPSNTCDVRESIGANGLKQYGGVVWMRRRSAVGFDMPVPVVKFLCQYYQDINIVTSITPATMKPPTIKTLGKVNQQGNMELCKVGTACPKPCPSQYTVTGGATYTVGEIIHLGIRTGSGPQAQEKMAIQELYLSCGDVKGARIEVPLVTSGCPAQTLPTTVGHNGLNDCICVSFQVPKLTNCPLVYIHAKLKDCKQGVMSTCSSSSSKRCLGPVRGKRSVGTTNVFGPIYFLNIKGNGSTVMFPGKDTIPVDSFINEDFPLTDQDVKYSPAQLAPNTSRLPNMHKCHSLLTCENLKDVEINQNIFNQGMTKKVYLAEWKGHDIAITKPWTCKGRRKNNCRLYDYYEHLSTLLSLNGRKHVVQLVGYCNSTLEDSWIATEWQRYQTLGKFTDSNEFETSTLENKLKLATSYLETLHFLHSSNRMLCDCNTLSGTTKQLVVSDTYEIILVDFDDVELTSNINSEAKYTSCRHQKYLSTRTDLLMENFLAPEHYCLLNKTFGLKEEVVGSVNMDVNSSCRRLTDKSDIYKAPDIISTIITHEDVEEKSQKKFVKSMDSVKKICKDFNPENRPTAAVLIQLYKRIFDFILKNNNK